MSATDISTLTGTWWTFLLRGVLALSLAGFAFLDPAVTAASLVLLLGVYFIASGVLSIVAGFATTRGGHWWSLLIVGPLQIVLGLAVFAEPTAGALTLAFLFAIGMMMTGALEIASAIALRAHMKNEFWSILLGLVTLGFGIYVVFYPGLGLLSLVYTVGFYALSAGVLLVGLAFRLRGVGGAARVPRPVT
jgi:uncharacterized membrane protein HdeD (DUF308 family)